MQLTPQQIDIAKDLYTRMTCGEMAVEFSRILGRPVSKALMSKVLSNYGIEDPKHKSNQKTTMLILKLWNRGTPKEIAQYLDMTPAAVRMRYKRAARLCRWIQGLLFDLSPFTVEPVPHPPMRIVHMARRADCVQLSIAFQEEQQQKAA